MLEPTALPKTQGMATRERAECLLELRAASDLNQKVNACCKEPRARNKDKHTQKLCIRDETYIISAKHKHIKKNPLFVE